MPIAESQKSNACYAWIVVLVVTLYGVLTSAADAQLRKSPIAGRQLIEPELAPTNGKLNLGSDEQSARSDAGSLAPWVVSTRRCPQQFGPWGMSPQLGYFEVKQDGTGLIRRDKDSLVASIDPQVPVCIVVHGSYITNQSVDKDAFRTFQWLRTAGGDRPMHFVYFTWPSEGIFTLDPSNGTTSALPQLDIAILGQRADYNAFYLVRLIHMIPKDHEICLIGHSHGARTVVAAMNLMDGGHVQGFRVHRDWLTEHRINVVLAAAAIDHDWLNPGRRFGRALQRTDRLLVFKNTRDLALSIYPLRRPFSASALGMTGFTLEDRRQLGVLNDKIGDVDVTDLLQSKHLWTHYYKFAAIAHELIPYIHVSSEDTSEE